MVNSRELHSMWSPNIFTTTYETFGFVPIEARSLWSLKKFEWLLFMFNLKKCEQNYESLLLLYFRIFFFFFLEHFCASFIYKCVWSQFLMLHGSNSIVSIVQQYKQQVTFQLKVSSKVMPPNNRVWEIFQTRALGIPFNLLHYKL